MTVEDRATFRSVILAAETGSAANRAAQILNELGHEVSPAYSPQDAMNLLQQDQTDLLVVDISNSSPNREFINRLSELPADHRPRELAIFTDTSDDSLRGLRSRIKPGKVHIFLKPLHMHGLLNVLRNLECAQ